ncbi:hypothetical protein BA065_02760 [Nanoarchaeota archaeon NZ13-N]|nr:MAG: hypothetical protein BA065_02760 [Nanoarchaeota archaeon NZ13-N]
MSDKETSQWKKYHIRESIKERQSMRAVADGRTIREYSSIVSIERESDRSEDRIQVEYRSGRRNYLNNEYSSLDLGMSILNKREEGKIYGYIDRFRIDFQNRRDQEYFSIGRMSLSDMDSRRVYVQLDRAIGNQENLDEVLKNVTQEILKNLKRRSRIEIEDRDSSYLGY